MNTAHMLKNPVACKTGLKRVLLVDDEAGFLMALKRILQGPTVSVDTAETVEAAMAQLAERTYHVVIVDVMLTTIFVEEGFEILRHVKKHEPGTRVIVLTAYGKSGMLEKALGAGADLFFEKPVSSSVLMQALKCWGVEC